MAALSLVRDDVNLDSLAEQANDFHARSEEAGRARIEYALAAGAALVEAKKLVAHGGWLPWLEEHFAAEPQTAQRYMRLAENVSRVTHLLSENPDLSIREALKAIAKPKDAPAIGECSECGDTFPLEELTDTENGTGKLCDNCLDNEPSPQPPPGDKLGNVERVRKQVLDLLVTLAREPYAEFDDHEKEMADSALESIIASAQRIKEIYHEGN